MNETIEEEKKDDVKEYFIIPECCQRDEPCEHVAKKPEKKRVNIAL